MARSLRPKLPLSICISSIYYHDSELDVVSALAGVVNQYYTRWSKLDLYIPDDYYQCFHATDNHAPMLKSIRFVSSYNARNLKFQLTCPRLERASLAYFPLYGTNIQWDNLTHLTLYSISINNSFLILRKTPRLVICKVSGDGPRYTEPSIGPLVLTSLRSLQLITDSTPDFLNNLIAPHLEEFSLPNYYNPSMEVITSFLRRSACSLRSFTVTFSTFPPYFEGFLYNHCLHWTRY